MLFDECSMRCSQRFSLEVFFGERSSTRDLLEQTINS
jgi:hypothetical protein